MRFKLLVLAALVAVFSVGFITTNANAQGAPDGIKIAAEVWADTGYSMRSKEMMTSGKADTDLSLFGLTNGSNVNLMGTKGAISGFMLFGMGGANPGVTMYNATYTHSSGFAIKIGKDMAPYANTTKNAPLAWDLMGAYGSWEIFPFAAKFSFKGAYLDLVKVDNAYGTGTAAQNAAAVDTMLPKIAVGYDYGSGRDPLWLGVGFMFNTYKVDNAALAGAEDGKSITAYRLIFNYQQKAIAGMLDVLAHAYYGINSQNLGYSIPGVTVATKSSATFVSGSFKDTTTIGGHAGLALNFGAHKAAAGVGYEQSKLDVSGAKADKDMSIYASFFYAVEPNFKIIPGLLIIDHKKNDGGFTNGKETKVGITWMAAL
jgi:hypothetical protein